jgi:hypothetical protein
MGNDVLHAVTLLRAEIVLSVSWYVPAVRGAGLSSWFSAARYLGMSETTIGASLTAEATRFTDPQRTSPTASTPSRFVPKNAFDATTVLAPMVATS